MHVLSFRGGGSVFQNFLASIIKDNACFYMFSVFRLFLFLFFTLFLVEFVLGLIVMNID